MRIEVTIAKSTVLPAGALDALAGELSRRINSTFPEIDGAVTVRYATANHSFRHRRRERRQRTHQRNFAGNMGKRRRLVHH